MKKYWSIIKSILLYIFLTGATVLMSFPLFWMISSSFKTLEETNSPGIIWIPKAGQPGKPIWAFSRTLTSCAPISTRFFM